jgi:Cytochrome bd-type quinol oxidase, subunit 1
MDVVMLSRLQFAVAVFFHFIFVPLTLGLSVILAWMETRYVRTGDEFWKKQAKFWGKLFLINFTLGVVTGITLEFQFGTNWSRYSEYVGDIFGSLLAIEATVAFFLESTFLAVWHFGWNRVGKKMHLASIYIVAFAGNLSALWIILANGFMQHPVGYTINETVGRAELANFWQVVTNGYAWGMYAHTVLASWALGGFFVLGVSAWHLLRKSQVDFFRASFKMAAPFTLILVLLLGLSGDQQGKTVAQVQPAKLAALESHWETGRNVPFYLLAWPDEANEGNKVQAIGIPGLLSWIAYGDTNAEVKGLKDFAKEDRPPVHAYLPELPWHDCHGWHLCAAGRGCLLATQEGRTLPPAAQGAGMEHPPALRCHHAGLGRGRNWPPALDCLWSHAHFRRGFASSSRECRHFAGCVHSGVFPAWPSGHLLAA